MEPFILKIGLLLFWSLWLSLVFLTNACEGLKRLGLLPQDWKFTSENYQAIRKATSIYSLPDWLNSLLFNGVILWQGLGTVLFWSALVVSWEAGDVERGAVNAAFGVSLGIWAAFMLADETFRTYEMQSSHLLIFIGQLVTLVGIYMLGG